MANPVPAVEVFLARKGAMRTLEAGVTTVRDLGADQYMDIAMRDLINRGEMIGPRMFVCATACTSPQRHFAKRHATRRRDSRWRPRSAARGAPTNCSRRRRDQDVRLNRHRRRRHRLRDLHLRGNESRGRHSTSVRQENRHPLLRSDGARDAVRAVPIPSNTPRYGRRHHSRKWPSAAPSTSRLSITNRYYIDNGDKIGYAPGYKERLQAFIPRNLETARKAHKAGVKFAMGSDAIYTMFGENTRELGWFVKAGMTPEQACAPPPPTPPSCSARKGTRHRCSRLSRRHGRD